MRKLVTAAIAWICIVLPTMSIAFDNSSASKAIVTVKRPLFEMPLMEDAVIAKYADMAEKFLESVNNSAAATDVQSSAVATSGPASPLNYLEVYAAISSNYPTYEYFGQYQYSSVQNHGGAELYIITAELGYGFSPIAKMVGNNLTQIQQQAITNNGIVVGYFRWWRANGYQGGQFTYQNTSTNYPYNTMQDWITIL